MSEAIPVVIGIDGGSTKTAVRMEAVDGSWSVLTIYREAGTNLHPYRHRMEARTLGQRHLDKAIAQAVEQAESEGHGAKETYKIVAAVIGTAGLDSPNDRQSFTDVFRGCNALCHLKNRAFRVTSDVSIISNCSTSTARLSLIAGTGSNCLIWRRMSDGHELQCQVGGLDLPLSDNGSAAWIGLQACRRALFLENTKYGTDPFAFAVYEHLDIHLIGWPSEVGNWRDIKDKVNGMSKHEIAAICEQVVAPMANAGNTEALAILRRAGEDLADMAAGAVYYIDAASRVDEAFWSTEGDAFDLLLVGGVWKNDLVFQTFMDGLTNRGILNVRLSQSGKRIVDPTLGAVAMTRTLLP